MLAQRTVGKVYDSIRSDPEEYVQSIIYDVRFRYRSLFNWQVISNGSHT